MFASTAKVWTNIRSLNVLRLSINNGKLTQKRYQHHAFSEEHYQEISKIGNTKEYPYNLIAKPRDAVSEEDKQEFLLVWPEVIENFANAVTNIPEYKQHLKTLLHENAYKYKQASGILVPAAYKAFEAPERLCPETIKLANVLGCCVNMMLSLFIITDDIIDNTKMRFGKPSWFTREDIGMTAISDATILGNGLHLILRKYFSGSPCHFPAVQHFHEVGLKTAIGMSLDAKAYGITGKLSLESFTMDIYHRIATYKGGYPFYVLPVTLGMYLAGRYDSHVHQLARSIGKELGVHLIVQNDILDCYGNPAITGKTSTDIQLGQCTWLIVKSLEHATPAQKQILTEHYGIPERESELKIRTLYNDMELLDEFLLYEDQSFNKTCRVIQQMPEYVNREFFHKIVEAEYNQKV